MSEHVWIRAEVIHDDPESDTVTVSPLAAVYGAGFTPYRDGSVRVHRIDPVGIHIDVRRDHIAPRGEPT